MSKPVKKQNIRYIRAKRDAERAKRADRTERADRAGRRRSYFLVLGSLLMAALLISRLYTLQIVNSERYLSDFQSRIRRTVVIHGTRGRILDKNGREVVSVKADGLYFIKPDYMKLKGRTYYWLWIGIEKDGEKFDGIADATGKIIVRPEYKDASTAFDLAKSRLTTTTNPLAGNRHETLAEAEGRSSSSSSSSSSSISSDKNSGNKTTTIVVEHQHTPQPTQEWQQCTSCWGSGNCRNCAGSGTNYIGSSLKRCSMCGGSGRCTTCSGRGGKNITVYR